MRQADTEVNATGGRATWVRISLPHSHAMPSLLVARTGLGLLALLGAGKRLFVEIPGIGSETKQRDDEHQPEAVLGGQLLALQVEQRDASAPGEDHHGKIAHDAFEQVHVNPLCLLVEVLALHDCRDEIILY